MWVPVLVLVLTVAQLAVAEYMPGIERFADKAFGARLIAYPLLMLVVPFLWWVVVKRRHPDRQPPYGAFTLVMLPFLVDVTGNSLDLFDAVVWWDDFSHFVNWALLLTGIGLLICGHGAPAVGGGAPGDRARRRDRARLGARRVVHVHPARHRDRHGLRGHPRRRDPRHPRRPGGGLGGGPGPSGVRPQRQYADRGR